MHFDKEEYNYFDYDGHIPAKLETFTKEMTDIFIIVCKI